MLKLLQQIWLLQWKFFTCCRQEVGKTKLSRIRSRNKRQTPETGNSMHLPVVSPMHLVVKSPAFVCHSCLQHRKLTRMNENKQLLYVGHTLKSVSIKSIFNTISLMSAISTADWLCSQSRRLGCKYLIDSKNLYYLLWPLP